MGLWGIGLTYQCTDCSDKRLRLGRAGGGGGGGGGGDGSCGVWVIIVSVGRECSEREEGVEDRNGI